jgi:DNA-binding transcriptional regulator YhcF (GntR family)
MKAMKNWQIHGTPKSVVQDKRLTDGAFRVYMNLRGYGDECYPSMARQGQDIGCSAKTIQRHIKELEKLGYLVRGKSKYRSNRYKVYGQNCPRDTDKNDPVIGTNLSTVIGTKMSYKVSTKEASTNKEKENKEASSLLAQVAQPRQGYYIL